MKHIEPFGLFEARDTWERAGDKEWNNDTLIYTSDYILCDGIRGIREFFKSYTGEFKNKFSLK